MTAQAQPRLTPEQYLEIERAAEFRHEYHDGVMYAMSGASFKHVVITSNLNRELGNQLKKRPGTVGSINLRLRVDRNQMYTYPDVIVVCGEPKFADNQQDTLLNPTVVIEVLSPSTESYDRGGKFAHYRTLESLQEYGLVSQSEARVEIFRRQGNGTWLLTESVGLEASCTLESINCTLALSDIYDKITLGEEDVLPQASEV